MVPVFSAIDISTLETPAALSLVLGTNRPGLTFKHWPTGGLIHEGVTPTAATGGQETEIGSGS